MEAREGHLRALLVGNLQFLVPIYQRTYDWNVEHCKQLYDDIVQAGLSDSDLSHFMGAITYYTPKEPIGNTSRHQLIDGQQRITTFMLLLVALRHELRDQIEQPILIEQILYNAVEPEGSDRYLKIKLTQEDNVAFEEILKNENTTHNGNIRTNYEHFCKWLSQDKLSNNFDVFWKGIQKLTIVHIATNDRDNAQRIFESMNSTGLDLSTTDLVQNHLLMQGDLDWQKKVYTDYWHPMEKIFADNRDGFDNYLHCYLTMKQSRVIIKRKLYKEFKEYTIRHKDDILSDLHQHAEHYACLLYPEKHKSSSQKLNRLIKYIHNQNTDVAHPLLLKIINDYESKLISENTAIELFTLVDSYLLRCSIAGTAKNLNRAIPVIMSKLNENNYAESIKDAILERKGKDRFPSDQVFKRNFIDKEFYQNDRVSRYILERLAEKHQDTNVLKLDVIQIEHIMPETLSTEWEKVLGENYEEVHNAHLRQIGNLTLTDDNQVLSNNTFIEKQKIYANSVVKMTAALCSYKQWTATEIITRSEHLANDAVKIWKCPEGYSPDSGSEGEDEELEQDHLDGTNVAALWSTLKKEVLAKFPGAIFEMRQNYANFKVLNPASNRYYLICSIQALKCKIYVVYNTCLSDKIIGVSDFVDDMSQVGHLGTGDLRSKIYSDTDIPKAVNLINRVVQKKLE